MPQDLMPSPITPGTRPGRCSSLGSAKCGLPSRRCLRRTRLGPTRCHAAISAPGRTTLIGAWTTPDGSFSMAIWPTPHTAMSGTWATTPAITGPSPSAKRLIERCKTGTRTSSTAWTRSSKPSGRAPRLSVHSGRLFPPSLVHEYSGLETRSSGSVRGRKARSLRSFSASEPLDPDKKQPNGPASDIERLAEEDRGEAARPWSSARAPTPSWRPRYRRHESRCRPHGSR